LAVPAEIEEVDLPVRREGWKDGCPVSAKPRDAVEEEDGRARIGQGGFEATCADSGLKRLMKPMGHGMSLWRIKMRGSYTIYDTI
jgi:hypothetical protein